jgi:hypothetical protein
MTDKSTPTKKDLIINSKNSIQEPTALTTPPQDQSQQVPNLLNQTDNYQKNQNFTFRIIKRRAPWNKKEDEAIIELVNKYGTSNWTIIANEMALLYKSKHRNGKQCRERWHNHLDPIVNKENWTEEEENILFNKHLEYGNKWSDISKFLPGRTDNSIKNHFYSKLRKFIRKILKQINKENLLKNNGIDYYKYNSDKVYKLLKKYKVTYKNVTKDTILDLIISTEKNQKGKIFGISEENKIINNSANLIQNNIQPIPTIPYNNMDNTNTQNISERQSRNSSSQKKLGNKIFMNKKSRVKKVKNSDDINNNNINIIKNNKNLFQSSIVPNYTNNLMDNMNMNMNMGNNIVNINNINIIPNQASILINSISNIPYKRKTKNVQIIQGEKMDLNNENNMNQMNQMDNTLKNNTNKNNTEIQGTSKNKKIKTKIKKKDLSLDNNKKLLLNKKRRRRKKKKVSISLSTPENKKDQINRIMPGRKYIYGLGHKIQIQGKKTNTSSKKNKLNPEDFNPLINEVEIVREGLEIHSKTNILMDKSLLTEKLFQNDFEFKPNLSISVPPTSPRGAQQYAPKPLGQNFADKNIMVGQPTPMDRFYEPMHSPIGGVTPYMMFPPSTRNVYNIDLGIENNFMRKNIGGIPYTPHGFMSMIPPNTPNTPKREINMANKIVIQNNNITGNENNDSNNINKSKKPAPLNMEFIENDGNDIGSAYPPFFGGGDNIGPLGTRQSINSPANIFKLSPTSPFIPRFIDKNP